MGNVIKNAIWTIIICAIALGIYKIFGGNITDFFNTVWAIFYKIVDAASNVVVKIGHTITKI